MIQGWALEERAAAHRQNLRAEADASRIRARRHTAQSASFEPGQTTQRSVTGLPVGDRAVRRPRPVGRRVGTWLIHAGTRLGGASISPS